MRRGVDVETAITAIAVQEGVLIETVRYYYEKELRVRKRDERCRRDRDIMRLAARGWTNARIAARVGLHPDSVSRIVQRTLRATPPPLPEEAPPAELGRTIMDDDPFAPGGRIAMMRRNRDIVRRAALGWTHEEIG